MATSVSDAYQSIKAVLDMFKQPHEPTADVPSKQTLLQAAEKIKADAAKIGLLCSNSSSSKDQLTSLAAALQQSCVTFCSLCHTLTAVAGPTLRQELLRLAQSLMNPCLMLVKEMSSGKDLKQSVGVVWDGVSNVPKSSFDNKTCVFKVLASVMAVIKDTSREMEELRAEQQQQQQINGDPPDSSPSQPPPHPAEPAPVSDLDYEYGEMSSSELQLLDGSIRLVAVAADMLKAFGTALLQGPELQVGSESLDSWESCLFHSRHLKRAAEDLGAAMYPPQDFDEVASASQAVFDVTELMIDECPCADRIESQQLTSLTDALVAAHDKVKELVQQAQQQESNVSENEAG